MHLSQCVCVCEVLAVTWQAGLGGAARGLLIIVGGAVCLRQGAGQTERERDCMRERGREDDRDKEKKIGSVRRR